MTRYATITLLGLLSVAALAQQPAPNAPVIHTGTRIVSVDVIVTDANGNLVHGLPASAFHVFEDTHLESIQDFAEHSFQPPPPEPPQPPDAPGVFTNAKPHWDNKTLNVLVLDALNTPVQDQMFVHEQLTEFVKHAQPGEEIAILALNTHLILVQSPTSDPELLLQSIKSMTGLAISPLLGGGPGGYVRARLRNDYTTDAFKDLQHYLSHLPGKKNVIYFSDGEAYGYGPTGLTERTDAGVFGLPVAAPANYFVDASQASFFYIGAHGLGGNGAISAEHGGGTRALAGRVYRDNAINAYRMLDQQEFADALGGQAFFNSNDLAGETAYAIAAGANYYSLNYNPHGHYMDGREHTIRIVPENPGYRLTYRRHYVANAKPEPDHSGNHASGTTPDDANSGVPLNTETTLSPIHLAMQRGSAESTQILFHERFVPLGNQSGGSVTSELTAGSTSDPKLKLKFRNFNLTFNADVSNIQTTPLPNGKLHMRVQFIALTYNLDCLLQTAISKEMDGYVTPAEFANLRNTGLSLTMQISVPAGHDFYIRTGIQDLTSGYIGTLEVPTSLLEKLPALDQAAKKMQSKR